MVEKSDIDTYEEIHSISENQFKFMLKRSTIEATDLMGQMMEYYRTSKKELHAILIDLDTTYEKVQEKCFGWKWQRRASQEIHWYSERYVLRSKHEC